MSYQDFGKILIHAVLYEIHLRICKGQNVTVIKVDFPIFFVCFQDTEKKNNGKKKEKEERERKKCLHILYFLVFLL